MGWGTPKTDRSGAAQRCFAYFVENRRTHTHRTGNPVAGFILWRCAMRH